MEDIGLKLKMCFKDRDARTEIFGQADVFQPEHFSELNKQRGNRMDEKARIRFAPLAGDKGVGHAQLQVTKRLFAQETLLREIGGQVSEWVGTGEDAVISFNTGEFRGERANATGQCLAANHKGIDECVFADRAGDRIVSGGIRNTDDDEQIDVGLTFDEIPADGAAVEATGVEVVLKFVAQLSRGLVNCLLE